MIADLGNEAEAEAFATANDFGTTDVAEIALKIAALPRLFARPRMVVFTQGTSPTLVAFSGKTHVFEIISIDAAKIVDTNGAGDAFVGGFLAMFVQGKVTSECIGAGHYCANAVIQRTGPSYPDEPHSFTFSA